MTVIIIFKLCIRRTYVHTVSVSMRTMTVIIILKLRIWRTHIQFINDELKDPYRYFQTTHTHLTYTQCINEDWIDCCLLTKWRTYVHTVSVSMRTMTVIILKLRIWRTHIQCINDELKTRYRYFQTTHLLDVHTVHQWGLNRLLSTDEIAGGKRNKKSQQTFVSW